MNSTDVVKYFKDKHPEFKINFDKIGKTYLMIDVENDLTAAYLHKDTFRIYSLMLSIDHIDTRPHFIGEYEDWDIDTIKKLIEDYHKSKRKAELYLKMYKIGKAKEKIEKDF